jgi:WXXGXW repeat (2 copies)
MHLHRKRGFVSFVVATAAAALLSACVVVPAGHRSGYVSIAPPLPRVGVRIDVPGPGHIWIGGHWGWHGGRHEWQEGRWERERAGEVWVPHRWERDSGGWYEVPGHWRRR